MTSLSIRRDLSHLPDVIDPLASSHRRRPRVLTPIVGPLRYSFSGISWHLAEAAFSEGMLDAAFALSAGQNGRNRLLSAAGAFWKLHRRLRGQKYNGYKYHPQYHDVLWRQHLRYVADTVLINNFQLYGPYFRRHYKNFQITPCFYIDGTLREYFETYAASGDRVVTDVGEDVRQRAIAVEREDYASATRIIAMSRATQQTLSNTYGVPPERIAFVMPGANLSDDAVPLPSPHNGWIGDEFTVGFVGFYPLRKGLPTIAEAVQILRGRNMPIRLRVIGRCPPEIIAMDGVDYLGVIDKATDTARFIDVIRGVDLGCQLSRADLTGIAMLEFLRVGVPFLATDIGGMPDVAAAGGGALIVSPTITAEALADELARLMTDSDRYCRLRQEAVARASWASWRRAAKELDEALSIIQ